MANYPIIPCKETDGWKDVVAAYADALQAAAHTVGNHGMNEEEFLESGLFKSAVERLRGQSAASMGVKKLFISNVLDVLRDQGRVVSWQFAGAGDRHDYEVALPDGRICCIEAKGCLDGNNTNIFKRPANADEFIIWSLCQNPGANPRHNAWSGIHTRLSAEIIARRERVDGLVIWDMLCGTAARPCPKVINDPTRVTEVGGKNLPPPCIYLFPRSIPDARNNPKPRPWGLKDVHFLDILAQAFPVPENEAISVEIEARMEGVDVQRLTRYRNGANVLHESKWTTVRRAN
ncbi:hypothetical protein GTP45_26680 [Pseudoduganella sp. FT55W]|uniref:Uncharacterized protein n=1 Tax=Duganella rivi TaxID=2666083 RepID=A0A7X4GXG9_9BURK|nr:hypothetical protein [Duganella rivi]MYM70364.1 hypothetical protein [Duganella rivi]